MTVIQQFTLNATGQCYLLSCPETYLNEYETEGYDTHSDNYDGLML